MADDDDKKTETAPDPVEKPVETVTEPKPPVDSDRIGKLEEKVDALIELVSSSSPLPADETPTKMPWTHKRFS